MMYWDLERRRSICWINWSLADVGFRERAGDADDELKSVNTNHLTSNTFTKETLNNIDGWNH